MNYDFINYYGKGWHGASFTRLIETSAKENSLKPRQTW